MSQDGKHTSNKRQKTTNSTMGANQNYYDILGVDKQATAEGKFFFAMKYTSYALCINITTVHTTNTTVLTYNNT